ncbi:MAG: hypothetical protein KGD64_10395 [Candidatus Heimdallarchaeota archaeon]|nr:hypothetical protein [Candidatus Heimdallarchaeota archaeon]
MKDRVSHLQELSNNSWPAKNILLLNGWIIRISEGVTNRANSVLPLRYSGTNVHEDIKEVENIYSSNNLPVIFQVPDYYE